MNKIKQNIKNIQKVIENRPFFFVRLGYFLLLYLFIAIWHPVYTEIHFGYRVITEDGFIRYLIFGIIFLFLAISWKKIAILKEYPNKPLQTGIFTLIGIIIFNISARSLPFINPDSPNDLLLMQIFLNFFGSLAFLIAIFNFKFIKRFWMEIILAILFLVPFRLTPILIDNFWEYSSKITIWGLSILLPLTRQNFEIITENYSVSLVDFNVIIGPPCAGIHSLTAFTVLFFFYVAMMGGYKKILPTKTAIAFIIGFVSVFFLNTFRVLLILLVGAFYSEDFAINLFHNGIGAILFIIYFIGYTSLIMPRISKPKN